MIQENISLSTFTTFKIGGPARYFVKVKTKEDLIESLNFARENNLIIFVLGGGSNVLVDDNGFDGLVIKIENTKLSIKEEGNKVLFEASAGMSWDDLVKKAIENNLQGIECLSGIPGTVGAAPVQNIGAYGQELKDVFVRLQAYDTKLNNFVTLLKEECNFGYRDSLFKSKEFKNRYIIWKVTLLLNKDVSPTISYESLSEYLLKENIKSPSLTDVRKAVLTLRKNRHIDPQVSGNAGSFFKNPVVSNKALKLLQEKFPDIPFFESGKNKVKLFAGWLIETCGWKGKSVNNASVSSKHALVIINKNGNATANEVKDLASKIQTSVYETFSIKLEYEVNLI